MKKRIFIARISEVPSDKPLGCSDHKLMICRVRGGLKAFQLECPHRGVNLSDGKLPIRNDMLVCWAHKFIYDLKTGENIRTAAGLPFTPPLKEFRLIEEDGNLFVELEEESDQ